MRSVAIPVLLAGALAGCRTTPVVASQPGAAIAESGLRYVIVSVEKLE